MRHLLVIIGCLSLFPPTLCADVVRLKTGMVIEGRIIGETEQRLTISTGTVSISYLKAEIKWIEKDELPGWNLVKVEKVLSGETVVLDNKDGLRYIGIEIPRNLGPTVMKEATAFNKHLVEGKVVGMELDVEQTNRAGNTLAYIFIGDVFVNEEMVRLGYAKARKSGRNIRYRDTLLRAQDEARRERRGLWKEPSSQEQGGSVEKCIAPRKSRLYHKPGCPDVEGVPEAELLSFESYQAAIDSGRIGCPKCSP